MYPCEWKANSIESIRKTFSSDQLSIIFICDGTATSFGDFKKYVSTKNSNNKTYLYDKDSILFKSGVSGYPTEILLKNNGVFSVTEGFDSMISNKYLDAEIKKIKRILNDK